MPPICTDSLNDRTVFRIAGRILTIILFQSKYLNLILERREAWKIGRVNEFEAVEPQEPHPAIFNVGKRRTRVLFGLHGIFTIGVQEVFNHNIQTTSLL